MKRTLTLPGGVPAPSICAELSTLASSRWYDAISTVYCNYSGMFYWDEANLRLAINARSGAIASIFSLTS